MAKAIVIGPPLVGKTTTINYLRSHTNLPILELDEELVKLNNGEWPTDEKYRNSVLVPQVIEKIQSLDEIIFFTSAFSQDFLRSMREKQFKIIQLMLDKQELLGRNRIRSEGNELDGAEAIEQNYKTQQEVKEAGLVDVTIYTNKPVEEVAKELLTHLN